MTRTRSTIWTLAALWLSALAPVTAVHAEGSRNMFPNGASGNRANIEWRTSTYGSLLLRRTLLKVYAQAGEYLLVGSSGVGVGSGDILIYKPGDVTGTVGNETFLAAPVFLASSQAGKGKITTRAQELAGPQSVDGTQNTTGYAPASYLVPAGGSGVYSVVLYGPDGANSNNDGTVGGDVALTNTSDFNANQKSGVAAWDVTVRDGTVSSTSDKNGRLFASYLALFVGANSRNLYSNVYAVTTDGFQYRINLNGLDPNGFILYGNQVGYLDSDGASPLYHDVLGSDNQVNSPQGGCTPSLPSYPLFFNVPDTLALIAAGVATTPILPTISGLTFTGNGGSGGNNSHLGSGGTFQFSDNGNDVYEIVISRDGVNFDPTNSANRSLRGVATAGLNTVTWDGKDNSGANLPVGTGYAVRAFVHGGEYHFPLLDAENSPQGGPSFSLQNASNPLGNSTGFYDDRGYRTLGGFNVTSNSAPGTSGTAATVGQPLGGNGVPNPAFSDPINGYNTTTTQRAYGNGSSSGFGDTKGLDVWTYYPSSTATSTLNVESTPKMLLVKRITAINGVAQNGFTDDPGTPDDNSPYWPTPAGTYLRGALNGAQVRPGDIVEYTIYFVCTVGAATDFTLADVVPANMTFQSDAYTGLTPGDGGPAGAPSGIALALNSSTLPTDPTNYLTNAADADRGQFYLPNTSAPAAANPPGFSAPLPAASNPNGVVVVNVVSSPALLPSATGAGTPTNSYGFVRFTAKVN